MNALIPEPRGEHRVESVPLKMHRLVAEIDATLKPQAFELPQRKRIANIHHQREANELG